MWAAALNVPNQLTYLRIVLAIVMFCTIAWEFYLASMVLFILAAGTDWLDGFWARRYGQITPLGRIIDPFADKVTICGTFIFLAAIPEMHDAAWGWGCPRRHGEYHIGSVPRGLVLPGLSAEGTGSGFIIKPTGEILTNNHVVSGSAKLTVTLADKKVYKAKVLGTDRAQRPGADQDRYGPQAAVTAAGQLRHPGGGAKGARHRQSVPL